MVRMLSSVYQFSILKC